MCTSFFIRIIALTNWLDEENANAYQHIDETYFKGKIQLKLIKRNLLKEKPEYDPLRRRNYKEKITVESLYYNLHLRGCMGFSSVDELQNTLIFL